MITEMAFSNRPQMSGIQFPTCGEVWQSPYRSYPRTDYLVVNAQQCALRLDDNETLRWRTQQSKNVLKLPQPD